MITKVPLFWVLPAWASVATAYFISAYCMIWRKTGVNMWKIWSETNMSNPKTEHRFAQEVARFPLWHSAYQFIKWGTLAVVLAYLASVVLFLSR